MWGWRIKDIKLSGDGLVSGQWLLVQCIKYQVINIFVQSIDCTHMNLSPKWHVNNLVEFWHDMDYHVAATSARVQRGTWKNQFSIRLPFIFLPYPS